MSFVLKYLPCCLEAYLMHPCNQFLWSCHHFSLRPAGNPYNIGHHGLCFNAQESDIQVHASTKGRKMALQCRIKVANKSQRRGIQGMSARYKERMVPVQIKGFIWIKKRLVQFQHGVIFRPLCLINSGSYVFVKHRHHALISSNWKLVHILE